MIKRRGESVRQYGSVYINDDGSLYVMLMNGRKFRVSEETHEILYKDAM